MIKSVGAGVVLQIIFWVVGFAKQDMTWVESLSFYFVGLCVLLAAMLSFSALFPDTSTAYYMDQKAVRASDKSRFRWSLHLMLIALPSIVVYLLFAYNVV